MLNSSRPDSGPSFVINASRVARQGGLRTFAREMMSTLVSMHYSVPAVVPEDFDPPPGISPIRTPARLSGGSNISLARPIEWYLYSLISLPVPKGARILCTTHHVLPGRGAQIVTVHDLRPFFHPDNPVQSFYFRHLLPTALRNCDGILTVSESSRKIIMDIYGISEEKIAVVPNVVAKPPDEYTRPQPDIVHPYLLVVGASWPHKNIESLLAQHALWTAEYEVKIVTGRGQYRDKLVALSKDLAISQRVTFLDDVSQEDLHRLYQRCAALVMPSIMEGFGLPPLEAMAHGRPVIVSNIASSIELYGNHVLAVDTASASSWKEAFDRLGSIAPEDLLLAQQHAWSYNRERMAHALGEALQRFWPAS